ncbi:MAG: heterodisulfide reductase-related iron-sulfur binding cluster [Thermodesulfobacteriota bacterium]
MIEVGYYPGCSLEATARDYAESVAAAAGLLGIKLVEIEDWNCCGATAGHSLDHRLALNLGARNLALAARGPQPLVVPCALCFNRLRTAQVELAQDARLVVPAIAALGADYRKVEVVELNSFLTSPEMIRRAAGLKKHGLSGLRPVVYYGCQGQRPPKVTGSREYEYPTGIDRLLEALGAEVMDWQFRTDCCGASHAVARPDLVHTLVGRLYTKALDLGANCFVTGCQMCQANLDLYQKEIAAEMGRAVYLPVFYFTELIGLALGHDESWRWLRRHFVNPRDLLARTGLPREAWAKL